MSNQITVPFIGVGVPGPQGSPGPIQVSAATPATLTSIASATFLPGAQAYVQNLKRTYYLDQTSVAIPDNVTVIAAQNGGNWVSLPGVGILGSSLTGTSTFIEDGVDWATVAAGQTFAIYTLPIPQITPGEQVTLACVVDVQQAITSLAISAATNATPIVVTVPSTALLVESQLVDIVGGLGNTGVNGGWNIHIISGTTLSLTGSVGNGAYAGSALLLPSDFAHFERRISVRNVRGRIVTPLSTTIDADVTTPASPNNAGPSLVSVSATVIVANNTLSISVVNPTGFSIRVAAATSIVRRPTPGVGVAPVVTSASVGSGPVAGGTVTVISGLYFTGAVAVTLDGVAASFVVNNDATITATSSATGSGGTGDIVVQTFSGVGVLAGAWRYTAAPTIASISAIGGTTAGGTAFTLTGTHFTGATGVTLNGAAASFSVSNDTTITGTSGAGSEGIGNVVVTNVDGSATLVNGWEYILTPQQNFGGAIVALYLPSSMQHSGATFNQWNDTIGAQTITVSAGTPAYESSSASTTPPGPAMQYTAGGQTISRTSFNFGATNPSPFMFLVANIATATAGGISYFQVPGFFNTGILGPGSGLPFSAGPGGTVNWSGASIQNALALVTSYCDGVAGAGNIVEINVNNGTPNTVSGTGSHSVTDGGLLALGVGNILGEYFALGMVNLPGNATTQQKARLHRWSVVTFGTH